MTPEQRLIFQERLETLRQELVSTRETAQDSTRTVILDQASVGRLSRMDAMQGQAMAIESQRRREIQMQRIHAALDRIEAGEYGVCLVCEEEIDIRRLETDPAATLCIDCASRREKA